MHCPLALSVHSCALSNLAPEMQTFQTNKNRHYYMVSGPENETNLGAFSRRHVVAHFQFSGPAVIPS